MKTKTFRFEAQSLVRADIEARDEDKALNIFMEDLNGGDLDEELRANSTISKLGEIKNG